MRPEFIYFDLDNTLLDHSHAETSAQSDIFEKHPEFRAVSKQEWLDMYRKVNRDLWLEYQRGEIDRRHLQFARFHDSMKELGVSTERSEEIGRDYMENYRDHWTWIDGAREALITISDRYPVGIVTNGFLETQQMKIEKMGLDEFTDIFVITEEIGVMKPHPDVFDHATGKAATERNKILYVGDSYSSDIKGGSDAGWKTAWYTAFIDTIKEEQTADFIFDDFKELVDYLKN